MGAEDIKIPSREALGPILSQATDAELKDLFSSSFGQFKTREADLVKKVKDRIRVQKQAAKEQAREVARIQREEQKGRYGRQAGA